VPKEAVAALVALGGVIYAQLVTYTINRESAQDLRVDIDREIDIVKKIKADSPEAEPLERHINASIAKLVARDELRERLLAVLATAAPLPFLLLFCSGLYFWLQHGAPVRFRGEITALQWIILIAFLMQSNSYIWQTAKFVWTSISLWFRGRARATKR
jgi:hypothetical protein